MPFLQVHVDENTLSFLNKLSILTGRSVEDLTKTVIAEAVLYASRDFNLEQPEVFLLLKEKI